MLWEINKLKEEEINNIAQILNNHLNPKIQKFLLANYFSTLEVPLTIIKTKFKIERGSLYVFRKNHAKKIKEFESLMELILNYKNL